MLEWPLMQNNINRDDLDALISFLNEEQKLTQAEQVSLFEREWSDWLDVKHSVFVNSGSSANLLSASVLRLLYGRGEVIVSPFGWVSTIAAVMHHGLTPVFADIRLPTLAMDHQEVLKRITEHTIAVFITHAQGFNGLTDELLHELSQKNIPLVEDVCESHGATFRGQRLGSYGLMSNFSFYYAHHLSTIEGGMICTNDDHIYQLLRMLRSHGMVRESSDVKLKEQFETDNPDLNPEFIFAFPAYNVRNTEIGAALGRNQLHRLEGEIVKRNTNHRIFLDQLDRSKYFTDFELSGSSNYAFNLILRDKCNAFRDKVIACLTEHGVEFRSGSAGGGNQLRQPYLQGLVPNLEYDNFPVVEHVHHFGFYIGNYPDLPEAKINSLCAHLNAIE